MPPLVPQSTNSNPRALMRSARAIVSFQRELAPSTNRSPGWHTCISLSRYSSVTPPAGSISQMLRGGVSRWTRSSSDDAPIGAVADRFLNRAGTAIEGDDLVLAVAHQTMDHVATHTAEADEARAASARC